MTDEEMAEEYAECEQCAHCINPQHCPGKEDCYDFDKVKCHFLAGLKAGRPKWHKVADGDLPKEEGEYLVIFESDGTKYKGLESYYPDTKEWSTICKIIAWKEIVLPELKESENA